MANRTLITATVLVGLVAVGCEKQPEDTAAKPDKVDTTPELDRTAIGEGEQPRETTKMEERQARREPEARRDRPDPRAEQPQPAEQAQQEPDEVLPALTIIGVDVKCTDAVVYFPTNSSKLDSAEKAVLDNVAACLAGTPQKEQVEVTGRADPRGPEPFNRELSQTRAKAVADYLERKGVKETSFEIHARGEKGAIEGFPPLWPVQRQATVKTREPIMP